MYEQAPLIFHVILHPLTMCIKRASTKELFALATVIDFFEIIFFLLKI